MIGLLQAGRRRRERTGPSAGGDAVATDRADRNGARKVDRNRLALAAAAAASAPGAAFAGSFDFDLAIAGEMRFFPSDATLPGQFDHFQPSVAISPELGWESDDRAHQVVIEPFFRLDGQDDERTHFDVREAFYRYNADNWSVTVGAAKVFWGRAESRHLVDIINQTDGVEDIDEEDKLGQPMVNLTLRQDWGTVDLFAMSGFRDRTFPGRNGRLRFEFPVDTDNAIFEADARRAAPDVAIRYSHYVGDWDFGVSAFYGTSREARFAIDPLNERILPVYDRIFQGSIDLQYTKDAWLWKLETLVREGQGDTFFATVGGFEYTLYQVFGTGADLGLITEYNYDGRDDGFALETFDDGPLTGPALATEAPVTIFDNDVFLGGRLALNDVQDTSLLVGMSIDGEERTIGMFAEGQRRLGQNWTAEVEARLFLNVDPNDVADAFRDDDFVTFRLTRYF